MRYRKGYMAISDAGDIPTLIHIRNARALDLDQLRALLSMDEIVVSAASLRWRIARLEKAALIARFAGYKHLGKPVFSITRLGLDLLESRGHFLFALPSDTDQILHPSQIPHALELVNIRLALSRAGLLRSWKGELEITSRNLVTEGQPSKDYDAIAEIECDGNTFQFAIEYERSAKAVNRYRAIREILEHDDSIEMLLYLTANDDLLYLLAVEMRGARKRIAFALSTSFRRSLLDTRILTNTADSEIISFRDMFLPPRELFAGSGSSRH